jgi:transcription antitermination protein NusB
VSARRKARKRALDVLFSADIREMDLAWALEQAQDRAALEPERSGSWVYANQILEGVLAHSEDTDELLSATSQAWPLDRMPAVDRAILRIGVWELLHNPEIPPAVAIAEAVEIAGELSTEASGAFVHGILASIASKSGVS